MCIFNFMILNKTGGKNVWSKQQCSPNVSVLHLFLNAVSISFDVVHIYLYHSTLSNSKDINYTIPTANVVLHSVTRLSSRTILLYQFSYQRLIELLCLPLYYLFFNKLIVIIGADEERKWFHGFQFTLGFLYLPAVPRKAKFKNGGFSASACSFLCIFDFSELLVCTETVSFLWTLSIVDS
jgi:hypothetical protein